MALADTSPAALTERRRVISLFDLAGFTRAVAGLETMDLARLVDRFYVVAAQLVEQHGGRAVKFVGDACLAVFRDTAGPAAVACAADLTEAVRLLGRQFGVDLDVGANVHLAVVVEGEFGSGPSRSFDLIGAGVIHVFRMGSGPGIRISEPVYRQLPNDRRSAWTKRQPPATYTRAPA